MGLPRKPITKSNTTAAQLKGTATSTGTVGAIAAVLIAVGVPAEVAAALALLINAGASVLLSRWFARGTFHKKTIAHKMAVIVIMIALVLPGCVTVRYPDARTESRPDPQVIAIVATALEMAEAAYHAKLAEPEATQPELSNLRERAEALRELLSAVEQMRPRASPPPD